MLKHICAIFSFIFFSCNGEEVENSLGGKDNVSSNLQKTEVLQDVNKTILEIYISKYVDSITNASEESELPKFLNDAQFDYRSRGVWKSFHTPMSVRDQIVVRVINCKSLQLILESKNENYKMKPQIEENMSLPLINLSFYDLALKQYKWLSCD